VFVITLLLRNVSCAKEGVDVAKSVIAEKKQLTGALRKANYDKLIEAGVEIILRRSIFY